MRNFALMLLACILLIPLAPLALSGQIIRHIIMRKPLGNLWWSTAIGLDQLGGSILYGEPDWTISSRTWWLADRGNRWARGFMRIINLFFGKNHCQNSYRNEFNNVGAGFMPAHQPKEA